ncbi:MAG: PKD domain-containing protein, partial [Deltaproteobacteria bacterium]|nr:PKD domain-containing protein [Deltaproteobacteria bacterium]
APTANAGADQTKAEAQLVTLNGSGSDPDGSIVSYQWTQTGGTAVILSSATAAQPSFTAPNVGQAGATLTFSLKVTDPQGLYSTDTVVINVTWVNAAPTANAGADQTKAEGEIVTLNGSGSDPDGSVVSYQWTQTGGNAVTLSSSRVAQPTFTAPDTAQAGATLTFNLTVTDPQGLQGTDTVDINITYINTVPVANAGPDQNMEEGEVVVLNGLNSIDPDGTIDSYEWKQTSGTIVTLSSSITAQPTFTAPFVNPEGESLIFELTVTDSQGLKSTDSCIVNIVWVNDPPTADAGDDQNINEGQQVTLYGIDSIDPDGTIASYQWKQTSGTIVTLSSSITAQPTFMAPYVNPEGESLAFELTVTDSEGLKSSDSCIVNVLWVNDPPVANAGKDQNVISGRSVTLNGSASVDHDGYIVSYMWSQLSGTPVTLKNPAAVKPTFTPKITTQSETLVFQLVVTDDGGLKSSSECTVKVTKSTRTIRSMWNLVTLWKSTQSTTVNGTLSSIMDNIISIWSYDNGSWKVYDQSKPETSNILNELTPGTAVWMNMSQDAELTISDDESVDPVSLTPGWNLVGYNSPVSRNVSDAISTISKDVKSVWTYEDGKWKVFDPQNPGLSDLNVLEPGFGYWVKVDKQCSWTY